MKQITTLMEAAEARSAGKELIFGAPDIEQGIQELEQDIAKGLIHIKPEEITLVKWVNIRNPNNIEWHDIDSRPRYIGWEEVCKVTGTVEDIQEQDKP